MTPGVMCPAVAETEQSHPVSCRVDRDGPQSDASDDEQAHEPLLAGLL